MKNKVRLEDFPNIENYYKTYYASNPETGECAVFNKEKELLFHSCFSPGGEITPSFSKISVYFTMRLERKNVNILIAWRSIATREIRKFGIFNIETKSYILPMDDYSFSAENPILFRSKSNNSLFIIEMDDNDDANLIGEISDCGYGFKFYKYYNYKSKTVMIRQKIKEEMFNRICYGVYSCKQKRMILPIEFDEVDQDSILGIIVTKEDKKQMGIYSFEGEVLTELGGYNIKPICKPFQAKGDFYKTLVKISSQASKENPRVDVGVFTLDHQCIIPMKYKSVYYHSDDFLIVQKHNLSWLVYSFSKKNFLPIPPCIGVKIGQFHKDEKITIHATKYLQLAFDEAKTLVDYDDYESDGWGRVRAVEKSYEKTIKADYIYHVCYDIYSVDGELIREDVVRTMGKSRFCTPYLDEACDED